MSGDITMILTDPYIDDLASLANSAVQGDDGSQKNIRRPFAGVLNSDEYFAYISIKSSIGSGTQAPKYVSILDSSGSNGTSKHNHNFMLTQVDYSLQEKAQIIQTFGADYAFFFGQQPMVLSCAGFLLNSRDFNWHSEWMFNYQTYLRGTACVKSKSKVYLGFKNNIAVGYLLSTAMSLNASQENVLGFNFTMLVTNFIDYSRFQKRVINEDTDTGYTIESKTGGRPVEYINGAPDAEADPVSYVDFINFTVSDDNTGVYSVEPSIDMLNSTWWLPDRKSLTSQEAFQELAMQQYMQNNNVGRDQAAIALMQGGLLSSDPDNYIQVKDSFARNISNGIIA